MENSSRRQFLAAAATAASMSQVRGANDRIRLGIIGTGGRGSLLMDWANRTGGIEWVAVCDAWDQRRDKAAATLTGGAKVDKYEDYRRLLERKDIDGVIIATWDNTHSQIGIDACHAGKDFYVEKPMTSQPAQGPPLVKAVRETRRVVQVGMQQRSMAHFIEAKKEIIDKGLLGKVHMVRTIWNSNPGYITPVPPGMETKPAGLNWDACLGSLPKMAWDPKRYFNRFAYWDLCSGGQTGGLFVHQVDVVHWYLNLTKSQSALAAGGIYQYDDGRDTPDNINLILQYPERVLVTFEATLSTWFDRQVEKSPSESEMWAKMMDIHKNMPRELFLKLMEMDIVFTGTGGRLSIFRQGYDFVPVTRDGRMTQLTGQPTAEHAHMANWLDCMRSRKDPHAPVEAGHYSAMACHLGNIAYKQGGKAAWSSEWDV